MRIVLSRYQEWIDVGRIAVFDGTESLQDGVERARQITRRFPAALAKASATPISPMPRIRQERLSTTTC
jgi:hypothetical protein